MTGTDREILDVLEPDVVLTPKAIWLSLRYQDDTQAPSQAQISRRLRDQLTTHGLVCQPFAGEERGYYTLTNLGERFLHDPDAKPEEFITGIGDSSG